MGGEWSMAWLNAIHIDPYHPHFLCIWYPSAPSACWKLSAWFMFKIPHLSACVVVWAAQALAVFLSSEATLGSVSVWIPSVPLPPSTWGRGRRKAAESDVKREGQKPHLTKVEPAQHRKWFSQLIHAIREPWSKENYYINILYMTDSLVKFGYFNINIL